MKMTTDPPEISVVSDLELIAEVKRVVRCEHDAIAQVIVYLAEMDNRQIHLAAGFPSLYAYCVEELGLSEYEAYSRIEVARAGNTFPRVFRMLAEGALTLTTVQLLARKLTAENGDQLLSAAAGRSKREVQELLARQFPRPDVRESIRKVAGREAAEAMLPAATVPTSADTQPTLTAGPAAPPPLCPPPPPRSRPVVPLAPDRYHVNFTASAETCALLRQAKDRLSHSLPDGSMDQIVNRALKALLAELDRKQHAATERPRPARARRRRSRHIPAEVRREVWRRDGGRCAFVAPSGRRCRARNYIQYHHLDPYVLGGEATVDLVELRCRSHNNYDATLWGFSRRADRKGLAKEPRVVDGGRPGSVTRSGPGPAADSMTAVTQSG